MAPTPAANSRMSSRGGTDRGDSQPQSMQHLLNDSSDLNEQCMGQSNIG
jgi:hypothetical protein